MKAYNEETCSVKGTNRKGDEFWAAVARLFSSRSGKVKSADAVRQKYAKVTKDYHVFKGLYFSDASYRPLNTW